MEIREVDVFLNDDFPGNREFLHVFEVIYPGPFFHNPAEVAEPPQWIKWNDLKRDLVERPELYTSTLHNLVRRYPKI